VLRPRLLLLIGVAACLLAACRPEAERGIVLRLAMTQPGDRMREPFLKTIAAFEQAHPGVRVERIEMDDDVYQKMGLVTMFVGGTPPDVYFQWGGHQVRRYAAAGYALDLTSEFTPEERRRYYPFCWASCTGADRGIYLWPDTASITTVMWYRPSAFRREGLSPPRDWHELLRLCDTLRLKGLLPIAVGNRELWPGGNFAAYALAQYAGVERYNSILRLTPGTRLDDPDFVRPLELIAQLQSRGDISAGAAGMGTDEALALLTQRKAGIHPIGDWLVGEADELEAADLDAFRLPRMPGQTGDDTTLLALSTGYMINRDTRHPEDARALLRFMMSDEVQREWSRHGHLSAVRSAAPGSGAPRGQRRLLQFLEQARESALAPDVGFDLEVSDAFLDAVSLVLGGKSTPAEALAAADAQVHTLRKRGGR
jgi:raffinose/stachyose/melibiose transport system substrate-binding protein